MTASSRALTAFSSSVGSVTVVASLDRYSSDSSLGRVSVRFVLRRSPARSFRLFARTAFPSVLLITEFDSGVFAQPSHDPSNTVIAYSRSETSPAGPLSVICLRIRDVHTASDAGDES